MSQQEDVRRMEERRRQGDRRRDHGHGNSQSNGPDWSARDRENWRRGRATAWDRYAASAAARALEVRKLANDPPLSNPKSAATAAAEFADQLLAERDQRFGAE